jgi:arylsulfatase A-like enzyme
VLDQLVIRRFTRPSFILTVGDDVGWGDLGVYGGGEGRGIPTSSRDRRAAEGMTFFSFYGQPVMERAREVRRYSSAAVRPLG